MVAIISFCFIADKAVRYKVAPILQKQRVFSTFVHDPRSRLRVPGGISRPERRPDA